VLPFTRFVVGDGDYTPLGFTNPANTTSTHQLATLVCFTSYLQVIAEDPEFLLTNAKVKPVLDFIKNIPTVWDETIVLNGSRIGNVAAMARRTGNNWYVGILNTTGKQFEVDFSFLGEGSFKAEVVEDIPAKNEPDQMFLVSRLDVSAKIKREFKLPENGGLVIKLTKE
jgi:alpha-glucosidase